MEVLYKEEKNIKPISAWKIHEMVRKIEKILENPTNIEKLVERIENLEKKHYMILEELAQTSEIHFDAYKGMEALEKKVSQIQTSLKQTEKMVYDLRSSVEYTDIMIDKIANPEYNNQETGW